MAQALQNAAGLLLAGFILLSLFVALAARKSERWRFAASVYLLTFYWTLLGAPLLTIVIISIFPSLEARVGLTISAAWLAGPVGFVIFAKEFHKRFWRKAPPPMQSIVRSAGFAARALALAVWEMAIDLAAFLGKVTLWILGLGLAVAIGALLFEGVASLPVSAAIIIAGIIIAMAVGNRR